MTVRFDPSISLVKKLDNNLQISFGSHKVDPEKNKKGAIISRDTKDDRAHLELKTTHPDSSKIVKNAMTYTGCGGTVRATWKWDANANITQDDVDKFIAYHDSLTCKDGFTYNLDMFDKSLFIDMKYDYHFSEWEEQPCVWDLDSHFASIEFMTDDVELLCMMRLSNVIDWQVLQKDLMPDEEVTVQKSGSDCYIINTKEVIVNETKKVNNVEGLKLVSDSAVYKNTSGKVQKILKYYK
jgi:hypothetical protein